MKTSRTLLTYAPLFAVVAAQLLVVGVAPSVGRSSDSLAAGELPGAGAPLAPGQLDPLATGSGGAAGAGELPGADGNTAVPGAAPGVPGSADAVAGAPGTGPAAGAAGGSSSGGASAVSTRSKCPAGSPLQQTVTRQSVPCVPGFSGSNGGATYRGVTATTITVVRYKPKTDAATNSVLAQADFAESEEQRLDAERAWAAFFEKRYETYGRTIEWKTFQGTCTTSPPDNNCFRLEARTIASTLKPFAVFWPFGRPTFYDELSRLGVVNLGGNTYSRSFNKALRPFHYDVLQDGTRTAENVADYWCKKMQGKNATLAGDPPLRTQRRKMGIVVRESGPNKQAAEELAALVAGRRCGSAAERPEVITFSQDTSRAAQQGNAAVARLRQAGTTTVVSFSDPVELSFQLSSFESQGYHPEHLLTGSQLADNDRVARTLFPASQWVNAFGPSNLTNALPENKTDAFLAYKDGGGRSRPAGRTPVSFAYMQQIVWSIQLAGPQLTPLTVERALLGATPIGGWERSGRNPFVQLNKWGPDSYTAIDDARQVYWDPAATSAADGQRGAYVAVEGGKRYPTAQWPAGEPKR